MILITGEEKKDGFSMNSKKKKKIGCTGINN
jgi:hypothetical protein